MIVSKINRNANWRKYTLSKVILSLFMNELNTISAFDAASPGSILI